MKILLLTILLLSGQVFAGGYSPHYTQSSVKATAKTTQNVSVKPAEVDINFEHDDEYVGAPNLGGVFGGECYVVGAEASVGWVGFAIGGGKVFLDPECDKRKAIALILTAADQFPHDLRNDLLATAYSLIQDLNAVKAMR